MKKYVTFLVCFIGISFVVMVGATQSVHADLYVADLTGPSESPPNASPGTGFASVDFDIVTHLMRVQVTFQDLLATTTASHIHAPTAVPGTGTAGVATQVPYFVGFPIGVTAGAYDHTFDMTDPASYNPAFVTANGGTAAGAETALAAALGDGKAYFNIHTTAFPGGEIRGFLAAPVPEPGSMFLLGSGLIGLAGFGRKRFLK